MKNKITGLVLCGAMAATPLLNTSCSSMSDDSLVKAQALSIGAAGGALAGAAVGAGVAALAGGNSKDVGMGAIIGAGVGLLGGLIAGNAWGDKVVAEKSAFRNEMEWYQAHIAQLDGRAKQVEEANAKLTASINSGKKITAKQAKATTKTVNQLIEACDKDIANAKKANNASVNSHIASLTTKRNNLQSQLGALSALTEQA